MDVDGVRMVFQYAPESEAPADLTFYLPDRKAFCAVELATHVVEHVLEVRRVRRRIEVRVGRVERGEIDPQAAGARCGQHLVEERGEDLRVAYVALTRARHQAVVWWAGTRDSRNSQLGRLLFARADDGEVLPNGSSTLPGSILSYGKTVRRVASTTTESTRSLGTNSSEVIVRCGHHVVKVHRMLSQEVA